MLKKYVVHFTVCTKTLHSGSISSLEVAWLVLVSVIMEIQKFSFFTPIVHFYMNIVASRTFKHHAAPCQMPRICQP